MASQSIGSSPSSSLLSRPRVAIISSFPTKPWELYRGICMWINAKAAMDVREDKS